ncbi:MAG: DUF87 domain-containing protein, partial [Candidatus Lokiarchaeota archaeon]|nr:DUF87 domain-containing protein [Candidatus Lokiarchaeota archaeon]
MLLWKILILVLLGFISISLSIYEYTLKKKDRKILIIKIFNLTSIILSLSLFFLYFLADTGIWTNESDLIIAIMSVNILFFLICLSVIFYFQIALGHNSIAIDLKKPSFFAARQGKIKIGKCCNIRGKKSSFYLSLKDLEKHMFVCGATGSGKSNFIQNFLLNFSKMYDIPFLIIEFKGEYHFLQKQIEDLIIIKPGENFSLNIFNPERVNPQIHAERIFDILKSGNFLDTDVEYSPQMQKVLVDVLTIVCKNKNLQSWEGFYRYCDLYGKKFQRQIPMLSQTLISIKNRIRRFSIGPLKAIFERSQELKLKEMFKRKILIDLSSIIRLGVEKADALFFLNLILKYLWDKNLTRGAFNFDGIKHITIVEDAQYFAPKDLTKQTKLTSYLEDIALLQRGTGECLISIATHPNISTEILANCGALIVFKTHILKELLCELLNLDGENQNFFSFLDEGKCIIRVNSINNPFLLTVPHIKRDYLTSNQILTNNKMALSKKHRFDEKFNKKKKNKMINETLEKFSR